MGLETVKEEIIRNAKNQEESFIAEARKETVRLMNEAEKKVVEMKEKSDAEAKRVTETIKKQELASAELENKKMLLETKKQLIGSVFSGVKEKLVNLDSGKSEDYIKKLIEKARNDIEVANVYCNKKDIKFLEGFNAEAMEMIGGIIAENKEKTIRVDYSFDTMLESMKENELQNISKILFG